MVTIPRLIIAGTQSGVGKTTVAMGLIAALRRRGMRVQPFKVGPDYIDPSHLERAAECPSRNLDTWLLTPHKAQQVFQHASATADLALVEGVMGMFDGYGATSERGSTAEVAKLLSAPVILVIDGSHMARSVAAVVKGYREFDPHIRISGVIVNRVSERHFQLLRQALRNMPGLNVLGYVPRDAAISMPERHLGLVPAQEQGRLTAALTRLAHLVQDTVDLARVVRLAQSAPPLPVISAPWEHVPTPSARVRLGVARDEAFHFYYHDNLDLLRALGTEVVPFSPLEDRRLPDGLDALYLGGGFPEVFARPLAENQSFRRSLKRTIAAGTPTYAECGGLMYLAQRLVDLEGRRHAMVGVLPGTIRMTPRLQPFGYATLLARRPSILARVNDRIKGHEFHYSTWDHPVRGDEAAYTVLRRHERRREGFVRGNLLASYLHVHFLTNVRWARRFVETAHRWKQQQRRKSSGATP
ncbi:MAG: cobyrinate a,c-diamide synthase [Candidatus Omnitrophica bacterium]|nr:cobyrinate a,c-diamide synthase [Candidatus Omnitrophota bacterium]